MDTASAFDTRAVDAKVKTLVNAQLKTILKREGLTVSGVKAAMQDRIIKRKFIVWLERSFVEACGAIASFHLCIDSGVTLIQSHAFPRRAPQSRLQPKS